MKICTIRHGYYPDDPRDRKEVFALLKEGYNVDIICLRKKRQVLRDQYNGAQIFRIPLTHKRLSILRYIVEYVLSFVMISLVVSYLFVRKRYDYIQVSTMPDFLVFTTIVPKLFGAKILLDLREPVPELWITKFGSGRYQFLLKLQSWLEQIAINYADSCITVTKALRRRFGECGANVNKITVVPNVCDETVFCYNSDSKNYDFGDKFTLITHGLIEERYGHESVIKAVNNLRNKLPDLQFEIIGDGENRENLEKLVKELRCADRVHFWGFLPIDELLRKIRGANVGIVAMRLSPYSELIDTNKMYEYMSLKKPVIISRLAALEENFDDSCVMFFKAGDHEDLAQRILELYYNPERRKELTENAYRYYKKIHWGKTKEIYLKTIKDMMKEE